ncbi:MAG: ester cyclase [Thermomicrobiales bacterium]
MDVTIGIPEEGQNQIAANKAAAVRVLEEGFNQGNLSILPELVGAGATDHQHPDEADFVAHLGAAIAAMRTAFPDLHFAVDVVIGEGDWVAMHSVMTGTHLGPLRAPLLPPGGPPMIPPTGKAISVPHMHMIRTQAGRGVELFHLMDTFALMRQLGVLPGRVGTGLA